MKKTLSKLLVVILIMSLFLNLVAKPHKAYAEEIPKIEKVICEYKEVKEGDIQSLDILPKASNKVQYRVWLANMKTGIWKEITKGFTEALDGNKVYNVITPKLSEGEYRASVWIKRANAKPLNKKGFDSYFALNFKCLKEDKQKIQIKLDEIKNNYKSGQAVEVKKKEDKGYSYKYSVYDIVNDKEIVTYNDDYKDNILWKPNDDGIYLFKTNVKNLEKIQVSNNMDKDNNEITKKEKTIEKNKEEKNKVEIKEKEETKKDQDGKQQQLVEDNNDDQETVEDDRLKDEKTKNKLIEEQKLKEKDEDKSNTLEYDVNNKKVKKDENIPENNLDINKEKQEVDLKNNQDILNESNTSKISERENESGEVLGQGLAQSRQKCDYIPESHNDFIFSIIGEDDKDKISDQTQNENKDKRETKQHENKDKQENKQDEINYKYIESETEISKILMVGNPYRGPKAPKADLVTVGNANENDTINIKAQPRYNSKNVGYIYGSLCEVKVLKTVGKYYNIETVNYKTSKRIKGYVYKWQLKKVKPSKFYSILVNQSEQKIYIFKNGKFLRNIICSTGNDWTPTPSGTYLIGDRGPAFLTGSTKAVICYNWVRFNHNYLFHSVLCYRSNGEPIPSALAKLGHKASHGCIRVPKEDIKWFYNNIPRGTLLVIK
ncbi:L,D-transpeptidase family protein [Clostridium aestuarii]|uniref:L,D-transpeptidase family protein n=1 Tax=Clostridium aestuarii TaxID=338193 RepID=A0ABT4D0K6_9CLOT|nr:L,D-transpeptidase [Clostridium aestuarii]MCY6484770.1 L,D-transpeptidase family protein [Clostridium aestuarii]